MDKFIAQGAGFPADNEFLMFLQSIIGQVAELSSIGGENFILKGCEVVGGNVSDGWMVLSGEVVRFSGGPLGAQVHIVEQVETASYLEDLNPVDGQGDDKDAYFTRTASFGNIGESVTDWDDLERIRPLIEVQKAATPVGAIIMWAGAIGSIPSGWALCDGTNGTPNLSGRFIVGYDAADADHDAIGETGGAKAVQLTEAQMPQHSHTGNTNSAGQHSHTVGNRNTSTPEHTDTTTLEWGGHTTGINQQIPTSSAGSHSHTLTTNSKGGNQPHENRPPYFTLAYIQYKGV